MYILPFEHSKISINICLKDKKIDFQIGNFKYMFITHTSTTNSYFIQNMGPIYIYNFQYFIGAISKTRWINSLPKQKQAFPTFYNIYLMFLFNIVFKSKLF